jgi:DNA primase
MMAAAPVFLNLTKHRNPMNRLVLPNRRIDEKLVAALDNAANFYHDLLMSNEDRFKHIWDYLARRGVGKETIRTFNIGYSRHTAMNNTTAGH